jgi:hypothetical protein
MVFISRCWFKVNKFDAFCQNPSKFDGFGPARIQKSPNLLFINSKKKSKIKNQEKYVKELDEILRLLVKNFFFQIVSFGWLKFKFCQIYTNGHQILIFLKFTKYKKQI